MQVGFIGVGRMGSGIAGRILSGGHDLLVYDSVRSMAEKMEEQGATVVDSIADVCAGREVVFSMLPNDTILKAVAHDGLLESLAEGAIHTPMGTHGVTALTELDEAHKAAGQVLVASPVLGRPDIAAAGQLGLLPAGPPDAIAKLTPLFDLIGKRAFDAGTNPAGAAAVKLANNMVLGCAIEAMAEGFSLIRKFGVESAVFYDVMTEGLFAAPAYKVYGAIMAKKTYDQVGFPTSLGLKDTNLILAAGEAGNVPLPSCNVYRDRLLDATAHGEGDLDWAVMARVQARVSGQE